MVKSESTHQLLDVSGLNIAYSGPEGTRHAVLDVDLRIDVGECLAVVGESGSGKSSAALSLIDLLPPNASADATIHFGGTRLDEIVGRRRRLIRGGEMAMVFQNPVSALNPLKTVGSQIARTLRIHQPTLPRERIRDRVVELLGSVGIPDPVRRTQQYPHQFSGGMLQRAVIAMAIANHPKLLIADEPTSALDVTIQSQIIHLLRTAAMETNASMLLISHDLSIVSQLADRIAVMYSGRIVEHGPARTIFSSPRHPYTKGLIATSSPAVLPGGRLPAIPGTAPSLATATTGCSFEPRCPVGQGRELCRRQRPMLTDLNAKHQAACHYPDESAVYDTEDDVGTVDSISQDTVLEVRDAHVTFPIRSRVLRRRVGAAYVLRGVDLRVRKGETVAIVGESGSGKTTLARSVVGLQPLDRGSVVVGNESAVRANNLTSAQTVQMVFQDSLGALNPLMTVGAALAEPIKAHEQHVSRKRITELLEMVGLPTETRNRYPHQLSGGQQQRVCLARALSLSPKVLVLDEPVSALDVSVQAQILNLLVDLQRRLQVSYLLIAHDISMVARVSHRVAVMYMGKIVETGTSAAVLTNPQHPYTRALVAAARPAQPGLEFRQPPLRGEPPSPLESIAGCSFRTRCPVAFDDCAYVEPQLRLAPNGSAAACLLVDVGANT